MSNLVTMQNLMINNCQVEFEVKDGQVFATSLDVAKVFDKNHRDILAKIDEFPQDDFTQRNFPLSEYKDNSGKTNKMYNLTRDGFSILVMGFTGAKAYHWKIQFIEAFNKMEEIIRNGATQPKLLSPMEIMELQFKAHRELTDKVDIINDKIENLVSTAVITPGDCRRYQDAVANKVYQLIKYHNLPDSHRAKFYRDIHKYVKSRYQVASYRDLPHYKIDDVLKIVNGMTIREVV